MASYNDSGKDYERLKRQLIAKGVNPEKVDRLIYFEEREEKKQVKHKGGLVLRLITPGLIAVYLGINVFCGYLPTRNSLMNGKDRISIEQSCNPDNFWDRIACPGRKLAYLLHSK